MPGIMTKDLFLTVAKTTVLLSLMKYNYYTVIIAKDSNNTIKKLWGGGFFRLSYPSIFRYSFLLMNAKAISVAAPVMVQEIG